MPTPSKQFWTESSIGVSRSMIEFAFGWSRCPAAVIKHAIPVFHLLSAFSPKSNGSHNPDLGNGFAALASVQDRGNLGKQRAQGKWFFEQHGIRIENAMMVDQDVVVP
jgi:hypothetical protein